MTVKYKIIKDSENPAEVLFEKTGDKVELTLGDIDYNIKYNLRTKKEIESKKAIEEATMANVERTHPHIVKLLKEMSEEDRVAVTLFDRSDRFTNEAKRKLEELDKEIQRNKEEMAEISKQTGKILITVNDVVLNNNQAKDLLNGKQ